MANVINCPYCGKLTDPKLESCPHCGSPMQQKKAAPRPQRSPVAPPARQTCPNCHALVQDGDIICVACGTNLLTGQKIGKDDSVAASVTRGRLLWIIVGAILAVFLILAVVYAVYALTRDPIQQAMQLTKANRDLEAVNVLTVYLAKHPSNAAAHLLLGKLQWKSSQFANAADSFENASVADPQNVEAAMMAVVSLAAAGADQTRDRQITVLKRVVQNAPADAKTLHLLALELGAANDVNGEIDALKKLVDLNPQDGNARGQYGIALAIAKDYPGAAQQFEKAIQSATKSGDVLAAQGFVADLTGKPDAAVEKLSAAAAADTSIRNQVLTRLGVLLVAQGRFDEAEKYLADAAAVKDNATAEFFHAVCLQAKGLTPEAITAFQAMGKAQGPLAAEALIRAADLELSQGNAQQARDTIEKAEAAGTPGAALLTVRGRLHSALGEDDKARDAFQKAEKVDPTYAAAHLENGLLYVKQQLLNEGIRELEQYLVLYGPAQEGSNAEEVQSLVNHLKHASGREDRAAETPQSATGRRSVS